MGIMLMPPIRIASTQYNTFIANKVKSFVSSLLMNTLIHSFRNGENTSEYDKDEMYVIPKTCLEERLCAFTYRIHRIV